MVSGNNKPWAHEPMQAQAFKERCVYYSWQKQPWLKDVKFYPCGALWKILIENVHKDSWWSELPSCDFFDDASDKIIISPSEVYLDCYIKSLDKGEEDLDYLLSVKDHLLYKK